MLGSIFSIKDKYYSNMVFMPNTFLAANGTLQTVYNRRNCKQEVEHEEHMIAPSQPSNSNPFFSSYNYICRGIGIFLAFILLN